MDEASGDPGGASGGSDGVVSTPGRDRLNALARWAFLTGERSAVVGLMTGAILVGVLVLGLAGSVDVTRPERVETAFSTTVTGLFTLVTITVTINQLVLSRVLGSPERILDRIESVRSFREGVAAGSERVAVAPTEPAAFLQVVTRALRERAIDLQAAYDDERDPQAARRVSRVAGELVELADEVDDRIGSEQLKLFDVLLPVLGNKYSAYVHAVDRIRATTNPTATEERALAELRRMLVETNRTRHYFKTLYLHEALSSLSRLILLTGVLGLATSYVVVLAYEAPAGTAGAGSLHLFAVSVALAVALSPLSVLFAYGVRVATIASRTTTFGTFTPVEELP